VGQKNPKKQLENVVETAQEEQGFSIACFCKVIADLYQDNGSKRGVDGPIHIVKFFLKHTHKLISNGFVSDFQGVVIQKATCFFALNPGRELILYFF